MKFDSKKSIKATSAAWAIAGVIIAAITLGATVVTIIIGVKTYRHRFDTEASASAALEFTLSNGKESAAGTITISAGSSTYGYFQKSGPTHTKYVLHRKKSSDKYYNYLKQEFTIYRNNDHQGPYHFANTSYSGKYDIKLEKKNNKLRKTVFEFDCAVR